MTRNVWLFLILGLMSELIPLVLDNVYLRDLTRYAMKFFKKRYSTLRIANPVGRLNEDLSLQSLVISDIF